MALKNFKALDENIRAYYLTYKMIGGTNESYYKGDGLITSNLHGIFFGDTNRPELENKIFYVYVGAIPTKVEEFYKNSDCAYTIYKESKDDHTYYIVVFNVLPTYIHDYNNFASNKPVFASSTYEEDLANIFCTNSAAQNLIHQCNTKKIKHIKQNGDMILNLYEAPLKKGVVNSTPLFCFILFLFKNFNTFTALINLPL